MAQRRFRGEFTNKVDAKGRVSIPASFRRVLELCDPDWKEGLQPSLVLVYGDARRNYFECYTMEAIAEVDEKISALPRGSKARRALERMFSGQSLQLQMDETGRLVLSSELRAKLGIKDKAFFTAAGDTFQIWKRETFDGSDQAIDDFYDEYGDDFDVLTLLDGGPA